jgi:hypothetical protein
MSSYNYAGTSPLTFECGGTVAANRLVKISSGKVVHSAAEGDVTVGVALQAGSSGDFIPVQTVSGTFAKVTAATNLAVDVVVEATSDGKVTTAGGAGGRSVAILLEAASGDGAVVKALFLPSLSGPANS